MVTNEYKGHKFCNGAYIYKIYRKNTGHDLEEEAIRITNGKGGGVGEFICDLYVAMRQCYDTALLKVDTATIISELDTGDITNPEFFNLVMETYLDGKKATPVAVVQDTLQTE